MSRLHEKGVDDPDPGSVPVVLVHGILGQQKLYWNLLKRRLVAQGFFVHEVTLPALGLGDLRSSATAIGSRLEQILVEHEHPRVDLLAHSAGGLAARWYVKHHDHDQVVRRLVTMGSPHEGTRAAGLVPGRGLIPQVRPGSAFLNELNEDPTPMPTSYTAVWTHVDGVILPAESARLPPADNVENLLYPGIMHWGYLTGPRFARVLAAELNRGFVGGDRRVGWDGFRGKNGWDGFRGKVGRDVFRGEGGRRAFRGTDGPAAREGAEVRTG